MQQVFRYKLDFYYQQALIYFLAVLLYAGIRGNFVEDQFTVIYRDPIFYIMILFLTLSLVGLVLNRVRDRRLIIEKDRLVFKTRYQERVIRVEDIEWIHIGRERLVQTAGRFQLIVFKVKSRRRIFRIRVGRYERGDELVAEMERFAVNVPKGKRRRFGMRRRTTH